uniref:Uncharacterized protein n=1 Tax=Onchocerca volvulus TaxID=6282 RepID=A0A8R1U2W4_ONCVO
MKKYLYDNDTVRESDQQLLRNNEVSSVSDSEDGVKKNQEDDDLFAKKNELGANRKDSFAKLSWNSLIQGKDYSDSDDNFTEKAIDKNNETDEIFASFDVNNSTESKNDTSEILNNIIDTKLPILWINKTYQAYDIGLNVTSLVECATSNVSLMFNITDTSEDQTNVTDDEISTVHGIEIINTKKRLQELKLDENLLQKYQV